MRRQKQMLKGRRQVFPSAGITVAVYYVHVTMYGVKCAILLSVTAPLVLGIAYLCGSVCLMLE